VAGHHEVEKISTTYAKYTDLNLGMGNRRFTRVGSAFNQRQRSYITPYVLYYNPCRVHATPHTTPATTLGVTNHVGVTDRAWTV
jgi:hypothetical protein